MARQPRIEFAGAFYHVMARGDRREEIFMDDVDRQVFLKTMGEACEKTGWRVYAWVLMSNHYHWVIQTPEANLVDGMRWFQNTYTRRFNTRHKLWGHVFGGRYKSIVVESDGGGDYLASVMDYVHLNPVRAGLVNLSERWGLLEYRWSSVAQGYARAPKQRVDWLAVEQGLVHFGYPDTAEGRRSFVGRLEERARQEEEEECGLNHPEGQTMQSALRRGWYWGSQTFREKLLEVAGKQRNRAYRSSAPAVARDRKGAEELLAEGLSHFALRQQAIWTRASYRERVAIAWALTRKTNQPQAWIAEKLGLRSAANVSQQARRFAADLGALRKGAFKQWVKSVKNC